ncbi:patatin-like phospholipase family protein [Streptomyces sp. NPDC052236]|uniref:patatin-like phospholipase family protein n=1 Tax=Streptomyces sp. NPDC052236 TaxID=3365686 RepID=UPI0037D12978
MTGLPELADAARKAASDGLVTGRTAAPTREQAVPAAEAADSARPRIGLVLSGGGAKGAYHIGVVEYLATIGTRVHAIAGASIGALNGAILASSGSLSEGTAKLAAVWDEVAELASSAKSTGPEDVVGGEAQEETTLEQLALLLPRLSGPVVHPSYLERLVSTHIDLDRLSDGIPLWVSAFPAVEEVDILRSWSWTIDVVRSRLGARSEWLHVNALPRHERHQAVLASAALPVILPPRRVNGRLFRDGGIADNTPAGALALHARCDMVIVVHLTDGVLWDAHDFPGLGIVEIRPHKRLSPPGPIGGATALVDFSPQRLRRLRAQGFRDAQLILEPLRTMLSRLDGMRTAEGLMLDAVARLLEPDAG